MSKRFQACLLAAILLGGCAGPGELVSNPGFVVTDAGALPSPSRGDIAALEKPYSIGPYDKLKINVFGIKDLNLEVQADAGGRISFPLLGEIEASGHTPGELSRIIEAGLRGRYVKNPQVSVNLEETLSQLVTVDGQVEEPGNYPVMGRMTLMRAVAAAKGTSEFAKLDDVVIFRTVEGQRMAALYNLGAIRRGRYADPEIFANDIVVVGESPARRLFQSILQASPLLTTPIVALLQN